MLSAASLNLERSKNGVLVERVNSVPNDNILDWANLNGIADDKINLTQKLKICFGKERKHYGEKEKMLVTSIFSFPHNVF